MAFGFDDENFDYSAPNVSERMTAAIMRQAMQPESEDVGELQSEVEQGFGDTAAEYGMKGLGHAGDLLDIPGAFVRGIIGAGQSVFRGEFGRAGERLLSALPGSEEIPRAFGWGEGLRAPTGQDIMTDFGADTGHTMDEERRIRIAMAGGMTRREAEEQFTTRYEEESLSSEAQADFASIMQKALQEDPFLKTGVTSDDIERATDATDFLGFALEVATDPLTYATAGLSSIGKAAKLVQATGRAAKLGAGGVKAGRAAEKAILNGFKAANNFDEAADVVRKLNLPDDESGKLMSALGDAFKDGKPDLDLGEGLLDKVRAGQFKAGFKLPFDKQVMFEEGATKALEMVGNGVAAVGRGAMQIKPVAAFVNKFPTAKYWPKKAWLRLAGDVRKSDALGNKNLTEIALHEQHFNRTSSYQALKYANELEFEEARVLNALTEMERAEVQKLAPGLAENPIYTGFMRGGLVPKPAVSSKKVEDALFDYADLLRSSDDELLKMQQGWGLPVQELVEDFKHVGRQLSDEVTDLLASRPDARRAWFGAKNKVEREGMHAAMLDAERGRKLKGMGFEESEEYMRKILKPHGVTDDMPIWNPDPIDLLKKRTDRSLQEAQLRNLSHVASEVYGIEHPGVRQFADDIIRDAVEDTASSAATRAETANRILDEALQAQADFRAGRGSLRGAAKTAERQADEIGLAGARAEEVRVVGAEAQQGSKIAYQTGRDAEQKAVQVAEALREEAVGVVASTPGAMEAREALKQARKILKSANSHAQLEEAAQEIAHAVGASLPEGGAHDVVQAAKELVKAARKQITSDPDIAEADQILRQANAMLSEARHVAAKVETEVLSKHVDDVLKSADAASDVAGIGGKYLTRAMQSELRKAKKVLDDVVSWYKAKDAQKAGKDVKLPDVKAKSVRDVRAALSKMRSELRKDAPKALTRMLDRAYRQADTVSTKLDDALGAVGKPVAKAVNQRARDAAKKAKVAQEMLEKSDVTKWSPEAKAEYVMARLKQNGMGPKEGDISALELMMKTRQRLPEDIEDITALATRYLDEADGREFTKYATNHYWSHLDTPSKFGQWYDAVKAVYQRATLARVSSLSRDLVGTLSQGMLAGNHKYLKRAVSELGTLKQWRDGAHKVSDDVLKLRAAGVLRTTKGEALDKTGALRRAPWLGKVEESGVVGGTLRSVGLESAGKKVGKKIGVLNDARVYWEEVQRVATYRKAVAEGMSHDDAILEVHKFWGRFDEMGRLERKALNRILFFWSWMVRSVPTAMRTAVAHPVKARLAMTLLAGNVTDSEAMPEWMKRMGGWTIGQDESGNYTVINLGNSTYFSPTMSALQSDFVKEVSRGNVGRAIGELGREVAGSAPPFVTGAYERLTERESFSNEDWWKDKNNRQGSRLRAPAGYYWLEGNPLGDFLGVRVVSEQTSSGAKIKQVYMDPEVANIMSFLPGLEPFMTDVSSLADPRKSVEPGLTPVKAGLRHAGIPMYDIDVDNETQRKARKFRKALNASIGDIPGSGLTANRSNVFPDTKTERGREIREAMDGLMKAGQDQGMDKRTSQAWMYKQLATKYPQEARWLEINAKLKRLERATDEIADLKNKPKQSGLGLR